MKTYTVEWSIEVEADTPEDAVEHARADQLNKTGHTELTVKGVIYYVDDKGNCVHSD